jgi:hypothetical protein
MYSLAKQITLVRASFYFATIQRKKFYRIKKAPRKPREALKLLLAERVGFEPTVPYGTIDFELS